MLKLCENFFTFLNENGIRYCHWKSNGHLDRALAGKTDLDILVHRADADAFAAALRQFNFREVLSPEEKDFPGMADYLGFDEATGEMIHLHRHFLLVMGQRYIKNHHLPLEDWVLSNLRQLQGVAVPLPEIELLMLVLRMHLKVDMVSLVKHAIKDFSSQHYTAFPADIENELRMLIQQYQPEIFEQVLHDSGLVLELSFFEEVLDAFLNGRLTALAVLKGQRKILAALRPYRRNTSPAIYWQYLLFTVAEWPILRALKTYKRKTLPGIAPIIALVGADGSGKSTLTEELSNWLSWKLTVKRYYLGIPKNRLATINYYTHRLLDKLGFLRLKKTLSGCYWLYVARYRQRTLRRARYDAADGKLVVLDRFPLTEFFQMEEPMDGPRLQTNCFYRGNGQADKEAIIYQRLPQPDKVFVLQVSLEELRRRKQDISEAEHSIKARAVNAIGENQGYELIDANQPYEQVVLQIKRSIWAAL